MNILLDVSGKIDKSRLTAIRELQNVCGNLEIPVMIVGAFARDILFEHANGISTPRMTNDVDFVVLVPDWNRFQELTETLANSAEVQQASKMQHRFFGNE